MDKKYVNLFSALTSATAVAAEQVMEYDEKNNDNEGYERAKTMRDDFQELHDKFDEDFDGILTKAEYAKLLVGAYIVMNNLRDRVSILRKSIDGYEKDLIPKLQKIVDASDEDIQKISEEILILEDNK